VFGELSERGVCAVLSNSDTPEARATFAGFAGDSVGVARPINRNGQGRGEISEILLENRPGRVRRKRSG
jgi:site-specific DNA-adenine methylase